MKETFLAYKIDGTAHKNHKISINQLILSLQGFAESINEANKVANGQSSDPPEVNVVAFNEGSFEAIIQVITNPDTVKMDPLVLMGLSAAPAIAHGMYKSVVNLLQAIKGREFEVVEHSKGKVSISIDGTTPVEVDPYIAVAVENSKLRKGLDKILSTPLQEDGTTKVSVSEYDPIKKTLVKGSETIVTSKNDIAFQAAPESMNDDVDTQLKTTTVYFTKVNFTGARGWQIKLPNGQKKSTRLEDAAFLANTRGDKEAFKSDDLYEVQLSVTESYNRHSKKSTTSYIVVKVNRKLTDVSARRKK